MKIWLLLCLLPQVLASQADALQKLYQRGQQSFARKQYEESRRSYQRLLVLLEQKQKRQKKGTRGWHLLTLGKFDVLFQLAEIDRAQKRRRRACLGYHRAARQFATVPKGWKGWNVSPNIPIRLKAARRQLGVSCVKAPSILHLKGLPRGARVFRKGQGRWQELRGKRLLLYGEKVSLRIQAPGYLTRLYPRLAVKRWQTQTLEVKLKRQLSAARREPLRRRPGKVKASTPFYKHWLFWTLAGAVVAGGVVAVLVVVNTEFRDTFVGQGEGRAIKLFE